MSARGLPTPPEAVRVATGSHGASTARSRAGREPRPRVAANSRPEPPPVAKKAAGSLGLDAADYLPITREEIKEAAKGRNLLRNPWFGRRDLIPPADDPRTQLIDRAMVTQGLITPEQLAEIHAVGAEMDRVRPTMAVDRAPGRDDRRGGRAGRPRGPRAAQGPEEGRGRRAPTAAGRGRRPAQGRGHRVPRPRRLGPAGRADQPRARTSSAPGCRC